MARRAPRSPEASRILDLARRDRAAAVEALGALSLEAQIALVCETPISRRAAILELVEAPELLIPRLPEAELCFTVKGVGLEDAGWILEHATGEQIASCVDLDAWSGDAPDRPSLAAWLDALLSAGDEALLRAAHALDAELLVLTLKDRIEVSLKPGGDDDWQPPPDSRSLDSQFYFLARKEGDDLAAVARLLAVLFEKDYWLYFRAMQGVIWEPDSDAEGWALRWRTGRLQDLGFPPREQALRIYARLAPEERAALPEEAEILPAGDWPMPIWLPELPVAADSRHLLFRAAAELDADERRAFFYALVHLANQVAVADWLPLSDTESIPLAIEKAAELASLGLELVAREHGLEGVEVLRRAHVARLFRVGVSLRSPDVLPPVAPEADATEEA